MSGGKCVRCRQYKDDHPTVIPGNGGSAKPVLCSRFEPKAPLWMRALTRALGAVLR